MNIEGKRPSAPMSFHICMKISTALDMLFARNGWDDKEDYGPDRIRQILGISSNATVEEIAADLTEPLSRDQHYIPSEGCDNYLPLGRCKGHVNRGIAAKAVHL